MSQLKRQSQLPPSTPGTLMRYSLASPSASCMKETAILATELQQARIKAQRTSRSLQGTTERKIVRMVGAPPSASA